MDAQDKSNSPMERGRRDAGAGHAGQGGGVCGPALRQAVAAVWAKDSGGHAGAEHGGDARWRNARWLASRTAHRRIAERGRYRDPSLPNHASRGEQGGAVLHEPVRGALTCLKGADDRDHAPGRGRGRLPQSFGVRDVGAACPKLPEVIRPAPIPAALGAAASHLAFHKRWEPATVDHRGK
jgi:hypothetical protein